jgi:hypothetical protein
MKIAYNEFGNVDCMMVGWLADHYNAISNEIMGAKQWGPCGGSLSKLEGCRDPEYAARLRAAHQARLNDLRQRQSEIGNFARENGLWGYRPDEETLWGWIEFSPGGRKAKGWHRCQPREYRW